MCKKCAELKHIWTQKNILAWGTLEPSLEEDASNAYDVYHAQAMKHAHHKEDA